MSFTLEQERVRDYLWRWFMSKLKQSTTPRLCNIYAHIADLQYHTTLKHIKQSSFDQTRVEILKCSRKITSQDTNNSYEYEELFTK